MYLRNSTWRNLFVAGGLLFFIGLVAVIALDPRATHYPVLRAVLAFFMVVGFILMVFGNFVLIYDRGIFAQRVIRSPAGFFWMRIFAVILWLGVLPFVCLWVYGQLHHVR
jgi:hypothetical protein